MSQKNKIWYIIINPLAGSGKTVVKWRRAEHYFREEGIEYVSVETSGPNHAALLAAQAAEDGYRHIAAVGGDGTVHEVFNGLTAWYYEQKREGITLSDFVLSVIPIGSGNDWIRTHKISKDLSELAVLMKNECTSMQDVVRVSVGESVKYMLNVAGTGFDSRICEIVNRKKSQGESGSTLYVKALLKVVSDFYSFPVSVSVDDKEFFEGDCYSIAFGTGKYSGGGMRQVPDALPDDGLMDVMIVPKMPLLTLITKIPKLFNGKLSSVKQLRYAQCRKVVVRPSAACSESVEVDGEIIENRNAQPVCLELMNEQIRVLSCLHK